MEAVTGLDLAHPPFDLLDDAARARLAAQVDMGFHPRGQTIIAAGTASDWVAVILKGRVHAFDLDAAGHEQRFADYGAGDIFGAWAVMAGRARHSYRADTDVVTHLDPVLADAATAEAVTMGKVLDRGALEAQGEGPWAVVDAEGSLLAVYEPFRGDTVKPAVVLVAR